MLRNYARTYSLLIFMAQVHGQASLGSIAFPFSISKGSGSFSKGQEPESKETMWRLLHNYLSGSCVLFWSFFSQDTGQLTSILHIPTIGPFLGETYLLYRDEESSVHGGTMKVLPELVRP